MIEKARALYPDLRFVQGNARTHNGRYDVLFSNVCLQWVPDHRALLPHLMRCNLNEGGVLAVQMPMNGEEPLFRIIRETADNPPLGRRGRGQRGQRHAVARRVFRYSFRLRVGPSDLGNNLLSCAGRARGAIEWVWGARLRPYLARLNAEEGAGFEGGNPRESPEGLSADGRRPRDLCASGAFSFTAVR